MSNQPPNPAGIFPYSGLDIDPTSRGVFGKIRASYSTTGNTGVVTNAINYTPPATAGTYRISVVVDVTAFTSDASFACSLAFKSASGAGQTKPLSLVAATTVATAPTGVNIWTSATPFSIDNSATAITVSTTGTFVFTYNLAVILEQLT